MSLVPICSGLVSSTSQQPLPWFLIFPARKQLGDQLLEWGGRWRECSGKFSHWGWSRREREMAQGQCVWLLDMCSWCFRPTTLPAKSTTRRGPGGHSPANQPRSLGAKASNGCPLGHRQPEFMFIKPRRPYLSCKSCKVLSGNLVLGDFPLFPQTTAGLRTKAGGKARPVPQPSRCCRRLFSSLPGPRHNP